MDDPAEIPLFPLPSVSLFPLATLPLFVFEPRYRQMMEHVLAASPQRIGMVSVVEAHHDEMQGDPPLVPIGCEGEVVAAEKNADGTYRLLLRGTRRFRIVAERPAEGERLYRVAHVATMAEQLDGDDRAAMRADRGEVFQLLAQLVRRTVPEHAKAFEPDRFEDIDDEQLVNTLAQAIDLDGHDKQQLLELDRVRERQRMLCELMRFRIAELEGGGSPGTTTLH